MINSDKQRSTEQAKRRESPGRRRKGGETGQPLPSRQQDPVGISRDLHPQRSCPPDSLPSPVCKKEVIRAVEAPEEETARKPWGFCHTARRGGTGGSRRGNLKSVQDILSHSSPGGSGMSDPDLYTHKSARCKRQVQSGYGGDRCIRGSPPTGTPQQGSYRSSPACREPWNLSLQQRMDFRPVGALLLHLPLPEVSHPGSGDSPGERGNLPNANPDVHCQTTTSARQKTGLPTTRSQLAGLRDPPSGTEANERDHCSWLFAVLPGGLCRIFLSGSLSQITLPDVWGRNSPAVKARQNHTNPSHHEERFMRSSDPIWSHPNPSHDPINSLPSHPARLPFPQRAQFLQRISGLGVRGRLGQPSSVRAPLWCAIPVRPLPQRAQGQLNRMRIRIRGSVGSGLSRALWDSSTEEEKREGRGIAENSESIEDSRA